MRGHGARREEGEDPEGVNWLSHSKTSIKFSPPSFHFPLAEISSTVMSN